MNIVFVILLVFHALIHLLGFIKAFELADVRRLKQAVSRTAGVFWLLAAVLFLVTTGLFLFGSPIWWIVALASVVVSQILIIRSWTAARFGTIANVIVLIPIVISVMNALPSSYQNRYRVEAEHRLKPPVEVPLLTERDVHPLPRLVKKYLEFVGAMGKPRVYNFRAVFSGSFKRTREGDWLNIVSHQYDFFDDPARLFYIQSSVFGIPFDGLHMYVGSGATMQMKVGSLVQVVDAKGEKMTHGETVTLFNDMCLLAPATLIAPTIRWEAVDSSKIRAIFTNKGNTISAILTFDGEGALVDFLSNDRYLSSDGVTYTNYPWSTPVREYREFNGCKIASYAEAIWHMPDGEYTYARFRLEELEYNCREFR
jgi:hypothetical protein